MNDFIFGFFYPFKSIKLFFKYPKLIAYSIVPIVINLIIYGTIFFYTYNWISGKTEDAVSNNVSSQILFEIIQYFLRVFYFFLVLIICYFLFIIFGGIILSFCSWGKSKLKSHSEQPRTVSVFSHWGTLK